MKLPVGLRDEAQAEFDEAFNDYEARNEGRGVEFAAKVQEIFDRISADPQRHAIVISDVHRVVVTRFPFRIFYRAEESRLEVLAVFHTSRDPAIWRGRV